MAVANSRESGTLARRCDANRQVKQPACLSLSDGAVEDTWAFRESQRASVVGPLADAPGHRSDGYRFSGVAPQAQCGGEGRKEKKHDDPIVHEICSTGCRPPVLGCGRQPLAGLYGYCLGERR
ncbi:protein of unknown function [Pseudorhizobium banfieldiae]|uniref:Uncharacterized protein n=1 Tax=Pseudorhizobium banfieldiae TaxID=1125847 RepID=L0NDW7_9HYPH|nr:protein of unknown function [Pseudorhizobium banfieldiae]